MKNLYLALALSAGFSATPLAAKSIPAALEAYLRVEMRTEILKHEQIENPNFLKLGPTPCDEEDGFVTCSGAFLIYHEDPFLVEDAKLAKGLCTVVFKLVEADGRQSGSNIVIIHKEITTPI